MRNLVVVAACVLLASCALGPLVVIESVAVPPEALLLLAP